MAEVSADKLRRALRGAGLSRGAIDAAWPDWWTDEAASSPSARAELRLALARNLGLSPKALVGERVEFVWGDRARFKNYGGETDAQLLALNSFGTSIGRLLLRAYSMAHHDIHVSPATLRSKILASHDVVGLQGLLSACWALGIPTIALRVFPLETKSMHAMVVGWNGRCAILLARDALYPAPIAFTLAHEIGHAVLGHVDGASALVDVEDPATSGGKDVEENEADRFALELLTGSAEPDIRTNLTDFGGRQLSEVVVRVGPPLGIEPGTLALCVGFKTGKWPAAMSALRYIYPSTGPVAAGVNRIAERWLNFSAMGEEGSDYLKNVMGIRPK